MSPDARGTGARGVTGAFLAITPCALARHEDDWGRVSNRRVADYCLQNTKEITLTTAQNAAHKLVMFRQSGSPDCVSSHGRMPFLPGRP